MLDVPNRDAHGGCELGLCLLEHDVEPHWPGHAVILHKAFMVPCVSLDVFSVADDRGTVAAKISTPDGVPCAVLHALASVVDRECDVVLDSNAIFVVEAVVFLFGIHRFAQQHSPRLHHRQNGSQNGQSDCRHVFLIVLRSHDNGIVLYRVRR